MHRWLTLSIVFGLLVVCSIAWARAPGTLHHRWLKLWTTAVEPSGPAALPSATIGDALRTIDALEARSRQQHEHLLEDTQALADAYNALVQQNADRIAEIALLKKEIAAIRAELSALTARRPPALSATVAQRRPSRLAHSPD